MDAVSAGGLLAGASRVVVKIGSALLVDAAGGLRQDWLRDFASDVSRLKTRGQDVVIVSSGSIALGRHVLGLGDGYLSLELSQAAAAVGQIQLARAYQEALAAHDIRAAQVLVTLEDSADRRRYLNSRATLDALLGLSCVPIVNENDTVATDEIRFGDNDRLGAQVTALCGADMLILLSDIDGLYDRPPHEDDAAHIPFVAQITPQIEAMAGDAPSAVSKGGMKTKILAARTATSAGAAMVIANGYVAAPLAQIEDGGVATVFAASATPAAARKRWIEGMKSKGAVSIDAGAVNALSQGKSLLSAGVRQIDGSFERGDPVDVTGPDGGLVAKGLIAYSSAEARQIAGAKSEEIAGILGYPRRAAMIHRDNMAL